MNKQPIILIPAHLGSRRLARKALALIGDMPMTVRCASQAIATGKPVFVCTDSDEIIDTCNAWSIAAIKTPEFQTGTDRCSWAAQELDAESIVILQGDEPLVDSFAIRSFYEQVEKQTSGDKPHTILNGLTRIGQAAAENQNNVKALVGLDGRIMDLSRFAIKSQLEVSLAPSIAPHLMPGVGYLKQIGLYGGTSRCFKLFRSLPMCAVEQETRIEMLRWIFYGNRLQGILMASPGISVDTEDDLREARRLAEEIDQSLSA